LSEHPARNSGWPSRVTATPVVTERKISGAAKIRRRSRRDELAVQIAAGRGNIFHERRRPRERHALQREREQVARGSATLSACVERLNLERLQ